MRCARCGAEFSEGMFCPECGAKIEEPASAPDARNTDQSGGAPGAGNTDKKKKEKKPKKKKSLLRKVLTIAGVIFLLLFVLILLIPTDSDSSSSSVGAESEAPGPAEETKEASSTPAEQTKVASPAPAEQTKEASPAPAEQTKEASSTLAEQTEIAGKWLDKNLEKGSQLKDSEAGKISGQVSEEAFLGAWKEKTAQRIERAEDFLPTLEQLSRPALETYHKVWAGSDKIEPAESALEEMRQCHDGMDRVQENYEISLSNAEPAEDTILNVVRRMEDITWDEALSSFWNRATGNGSTASYWLCTDVREENYYLLHSIYKDPFSSAGPCVLSYVDLKKTITLTDDQGFNHDVPVFELVDGETFNKDLEYYNALSEQKDAAYRRLKAFLGDEEAAAEGALPGEGWSLTKQPDGTPMPDPVTEAYAPPEDRIINPDYMGDPGSYLCSWSGTEYMTEDQLRQLDYSGARLVKNEIFARHGRRFNDTSLQEYFDGKTWYDGTISPENFDDSVLNEIEKYNIDIINGYLAKHSQ